MKGKSFAFFLFLFIFIALFTYGIYWLWQRQPRKTATDQSIYQTQAQSPSPSPASNLKPEDFSVISGQQVTFSGQTQPNSYVAIYNDFAQTVTKADTTGNFQKDLTLPLGLNLVSIAYISADLKKTGQKNLTLDLSQKNDSGNVVYAGSVKSIFDNLITLTTLNGERTVKVARDAAIDFPQITTASESPTPDSSGLNAIRVGDYMIAIGSISSTGTIQSKKIQIIRDSKPAIDLNLNIGQIVTNAKATSFQAKNLDDNKLVIYALGKNSNIQTNGLDAKTADMTKDKKAIMIYSTSDQNNPAALVNILP